VTSSLAVDEPAESFAGRTDQRLIPHKKMVENYRMLDTWGETSDNEPERLMDTDVDLGVAEEIARLQKREVDQGTLYPSKGSKNPWYLGKRAANWYLGKRVANSHSKPGIWYLG
jgi:hypothetical protein